MSNTLTIARRELRSFFYSPIAYVVGSLFMLLAGFFFLVLVFQPEQPAELRRLFTVIIWVLIAVAPAVSMGLLADELKSGSIESLMTAPVTDLQVILGKWLGAWGFFALLLVPTLAFVVIISIWANPDPGPMISGYVGLLLVGGMYLAIGTFASAMTRNQIIAYVVSVFIILLFTIVTYALPRYLPAWLAQTAVFLNVNQQYDDFAKGLIDISNIVYFAGGIVLFLTCAVKTLESRRWR
jgi:gliding motility-associated transport system permease protein